MNQYCCSFGCCITLSFQLYQLWYYWYVHKKNQVQSDDIEKKKKKFISRLLIVFMFMICSGGGWWYRFCRQPSNTENPTGTIRTTNQQQNTQFLQSYRNPSVTQQPPPNYTQSMQINLKQSPYYQLYGPPPSYDTVVQIIENDCGQPSTSNKLNYVTNIVSSNFEEIENDDEDEESIPERL